MVLHLFKIAFALFLFVVLGLSCCHIQAQVTITVTETPGNTTDPDPSPWLELVDSPILFSTEAANVILANEVTTLRDEMNEFGLGGSSGTLTFDSANTGLGFTFSITADRTVGSSDPAAGFTYNDQEGGDIFRTGALSPGDVSDFEDDDVTFRFLGGDEIYGFGFDLLDSNVSTGETISVFDKSDNLLADFELPQGPVGFINNFFIGVTSETAIGRITFDENSGSDDIAIRDFRFAKSVTQIPELLGDVNLDGLVNFLDISPFISVLSTGGFQAEADIDLSGDVNFLDITPFIAILSGQ